MSTEMPGVKQVTVTVLLQLLHLAKAGALESVYWRLDDYDPPVLQSEGDVVIGGLFPLHYMAPELDNKFDTKPQHHQCSGFDLRAFRWVQTMIFAIEEINGNSSLLPGVTLGYRIVDSCDHVRTGLRGVLSLISGSFVQKQGQTQCMAKIPVPAVIGLASSTPTRAVAHLLGPFKIPLISYFATCTCLTDKKVYPSFLRTVPSDMFQVQALVRLVTYFGWHWVGMVGTEDDYSHYGIQAFTDQLQAQGSCLAFHKTLPRAATPEQIHSIVDVLEVSTAHVVVVFATEGQLLGLLTEVARRNLTSMQWVASEAWVTARVLTRPEFQPILAGTLGFSFRGTTIPGLYEFLLKVRPSPGPESVFTNMFWEEQFGCNLAFHGNGNDGRPVCTGSEDLQTRQSSYTEVLQVRISYNVYKAVYTIAHALHRLLQCGPTHKNSALRSCKTNSTFTSTELLHYLKEINFTNQFGEKVNFDTSGEPVPLYDIINWQKDGWGSIRFQKVGSYDGSAPYEHQLKINKALIEWAGGHSQVVSLCTAPCPLGTRQATRPGKPICCFDCLPCADGEISNLTGATECTKCPLYYWSDRDRIACMAGFEEYLSFQEVMGITLVTLSLLGVAGATVVTIIFFIFRATPVVKANNSEVSFLLLLSLKLCFLCSLVFIGKPSPWSCRTRQAAFGISFVFCISCILVKSIVVLLAFRSTMPRFNIVKLFGPPQQRAFIFCCTAGQVILCAFWLAWAPPLPFKNASYQGGRIVLECKDAWPLGFYVVLGYTGLLSCACFVLAFLGRKLPDAFNEAKFITFSMLIFFAVWISFIPAYISTPGKYRVAIEIFAILASAFGLLFCIFMPKCYIILLSPEKNTKKGMTQRSSH